jgi:hypothetical protein
VLILLESGAAGSINPEYGFRTESMPGFTSAYPHPFELTVGKNESGSIAWPTLESLGSVARCFSSIVRPPMMLYNK